MTYTNSPQYALSNSPKPNEKLSWTVDVVRQLNDDRLNRFKETPRNEGTLRQRVRKVRDELPAMKDWWDELNDVYSMVLQPAVMRIRDHKESLRALKQYWHDVGELR